MQSIYEYLSGKTYPGRGIIIGTNKSGCKIFSAYFIMGRSENSRNRIFQKTGLDIKTKAFDENKMTDPSLIIYQPVKHIKDHYLNKLIITNGDQTDTIYKDLKNGKSFEEALQTRTFEPDRPNFTPRISMLLNFDDKNNISYKMSLIKAAEDETTKRFFYDYKLQSGTGRIIHTYDNDGNPLPPFEGEPLSVDIPESFEKFTDEIWTGLNKENKISLFVESIDINTKSIQSNVLNKHYC